MKILAYYFLEETMKKKMIRKMILVCIAVMFLGGCTFSSTKKETVSYFLAGIKKDIPVLDDTYQETFLSRGLFVPLVKEDVLISNTRYHQIRYQGKTYYVLKEYLTPLEDDIVREQTLYVRTPATLVKQNSSEIVGFLKKGTEVKVLGYDTLLPDGSVNKYEVEGEKEKGYVRSIYLVDTKEEALSHYDEEGSYQNHLKMGSSLGGGKAANLDYFPVQKGQFPNNIMPEEVRAFYLQAGVLQNLDAYIALANESNINAFVVDIKENTVPAYQAEAMKKYSKTNYDHALYSKSDYQAMIQKLKDNGFYVIGRITTLLSITLKQLSKIRKRIVL